MPICWGPAGLSNNKECKGYSGGSCTPLMERLTPRARVPTSGGTEQAGAIPRVLVVKRAPFSTRRGGGYPSSGPSA